VALKENQELRVNKKRLPNILLKYFFMKRKNNLKLKEIVNFLYEVGTSRNIIRGHHQYLRNANDSIAAHSFRTAIIGLILAELEKIENKDKVLKMALFHDLAEVRTGDANFLNSFYRIEKEEKAIKDQWKNIKGGKEIISLLKEYNERKTKEAIVAKDADYLDQIFLQKEYLPENSYDLRKWHNHIEKQIKTKSALKIAKLAFKTRPIGWLYDFGDSVKKIISN
jgi:putative hydrolase of HD superfamily